MRTRFITMMKTRVIGFCWISLLLSGLAGCGKKETYTTLEGQAARDAFAKDPQIHMTTDIDDI
ncbi:MAG: hypothetical protein IJ679_12085, partial [Lachnospiraceae bacterium]|nr:hypothetical protein [Lachnospiraceae bacterium]